MEEKDYFSHVVLHSPHSLTPRLGPCWPSLTGPQPKIHHLPLLHPPKPGQGQDPRPYLLYQAYL